LGAKTIDGTLLVWRLAARMWSPGDRITKGVPALCGVWRQGILRQAIDPETVGLGEAWCLAAWVFRQAVCTVFLLGGT